MEQNQGEGIEKLFLQHVLSSKPYELEILLIVEFFFFNLILIVFTYLYVHRYFQITQKFLDFKE